MGVLQYFSSLPAGEIREKKRVYNSGQPQSPSIKLTRKTEVHTCTVVQFFFNFPNFRNLNSLPFFPTRTYFCGVPVSLKNKVLEDFATSWKTLQMFCKKTSILLMFTISKTEMSMTYKNIMTQIFYIHYETMCDIFNHEYENIRTVLRLNYASCWIMAIDLNFSHHLLSVLSHEWRKNASIRFGRKS